ncbi:MAG: hypothetical protein ACRD32_02815 [Nitrososphaerales archaeon]
MNRIKRISMQLIEKHTDLFSDDYEKNKEVLNRVAIIRSKQLRNEVVGYITAFIKSQINSTEEEKAAAEEIEEIEESESNEQVKELASE